MTKAERIFNDSYFEAKRHIRTWGVKYNPNGKIVGFNRLATNDNDFMCTRTLNAITKLLTQKRKQLQMQREFNIEVDNNNELALDMIEVTIDHERKLLEDLKNF